MGGDGDHVLTGRIAGRIGADQIDMVALDMGGDIDQLAVARGGLRGGAQPVLGVHDPQHEPPRVGQVGEGETRRAVHSSARIAAAQPPAAEINLAPRP